MSSTSLYPPPRNIEKDAYVSGMAAYRTLVAEAEADYSGYWSRLAREFVSWKTPFTKGLDDSHAPFFKWFEDGTLNVSYNCLDRQVERGLGEKTAIIFEADDGQVTRVSYADLLARTCRLANALRARGVQRGDRVVIYMSMSIEGIVAMQACARIGAPHSVVFGGFSAQSLRDRVEGAGAVMVITADEQLRGGKALPLKAIVDEAHSARRLRDGEERDRLPPHGRHHRVGCVARPLDARGNAGAGHAAANRNGSAPSTRSSCSTPAARPASRRVCSTRRAATCCMRR